VVEERECARIGDAGGGRGTYKKKSPLESWGGYVKKYSLWDHELRKDIEGRTKEPEKNVFETRKRALKRGVVTGGSGVKVPEGPCL